MLQGRDISSPKHRNSPTITRNTHKRTRDEIPRSMMRMMEMMNTRYKLVKMQERADHNTRAPCLGSLLYRTAVTLSDMKEMTRLTTCSQAHPTSREGGPT